MKKRLLSLALAALCALSLTGCNMIFTDEEADRAQVVAKIGDNVLTKGEVKDQMEAAMASYGITSDYLNSEQGETMLESMKNTVIDSFVEEHLVSVYTKEYGLDTLTEEQEKEIDEEVEKMEQYIDEQAQSKAESAVEENPDLDLETQKTYYKSEMDASYGLSSGEYREAKVQEAQKEALREYLTKGYEPSEDDMKKWYDENLKTQKESVEEDPSKFIANAYNGLALYAPEGYRYMRDILIPVDDATKKEISALRTEANAAEKNATQAAESEAAAETASADTAETTPSEVYQQEADEINKKADKMRDEALEKIKTDAEAMLERTKTEDFDELLKESADATMQAEPYSQMGYCVYEGTVIYEEGLVDAVMALQKVGDLTGLVPTDDGYCIAQYTTELVPGEQPYENVKEAIKGQLITDNQTEVYKEKLEEWKTEQSVETHKELLGDLFQEN